MLHRYEYNDYNELITDEDYIHQKAIRYTYDLVGNIKSKKEYELFTSNLIHETKYEYANSSWEDQLTKFNDQSIIYDSLGNPITIGNDITLSWMNGRELKTYQIPDMTIEYTYDKDGIRTSKTVNNKQTFYYTENNHIIFETKDNNMIYYLREANGDLVGFKYNDKTYYYIKNDSEDILGILDSNYNQIVSYEYDAYGNVLSVLNQQGEDVSNIPTHVGNINPFRYDVETKLYYLNSRYYNPEWGRFINVDGIICANKDIVSQNLYTYVANNPVNSIDSTGSQSLALAGVAAGLAIGAAAAALYHGVKALASTVSNAWSQAFTAVNSYSYAKSHAKSSKKKSKQTVIYRTGSTTNRNLTPRVVDTNGLSFTTIKPVKAKYVMTTVEIVNATGVLEAKQDPEKSYHYLIVPTVPGKLAEWILTKDKADFDPHPYTVLMQQITWDSRGTKPPLYGE